MPPWFFPATCIFTHWRALATGQQNKGILHDWSDNVVNHFWWCCEHCDADVETLKVDCIHTYTHVDLFMLSTGCWASCVHSYHSNWISVLHHVSSEHEWTTGKCNHGRIWQSLQRIKMDKSSITFEKKTLHSSLRRRLSWTSGGYSLWNTIHTQGTWSCILCVSEFHV